MILAVDIGNTNIVLGCIEGETIVFRERIYTNQLATDLEYAANFKTATDMHGVSLESIDGAVISSVVPTITAVCAAAVKKLTGVRPMIVGPGIKTGLSIVIDNPAQLGSDLVVDAVAGISEYPAPMIIIDMGTATTLSVIDKDKRYIGGQIMTGMAVSADALVSRTAQLPKVAFEKPRKVIGTNTVDCIKSGMMYSGACALDGMIERIEEELGEKCTVIATGGLAGSVVPLCKRDIILDDDLLIKGLMKIYYKNK
ncbi:MAG: type III pantothenate kinase [Ruminococcus sp.]|nr:type III pantothenate kinase [Ruminococcus sp.]